MKFDDEIVPDDEIARYRDRAMKQANYELRSKLKQQRKQLLRDKQPHPIWRHGVARWRIELEGIDRAISEAEDAIISIEHSERDPVQLAEMRAEYAMAAHLNGCDDPYGEAHMLTHTAMEEELFQQSIYDMVSREMDEERGYYPPSDCEYCGATAYDDDYVAVNGEWFCNHCYEDAQGFMALLGYITNTAIRKGGRWGDEWDFVREDDDYDEWEAA